MDERLGRHRNMRSSPSRILGLALVLVLAKTPPTLAMAEQAPFLPHIPASEGFSYPGISSTLFAANRGPGPESAKDLEEPASRPTASDEKPGLEDLGLADEPAGLDELGLADEPFDDGFLDDLDDISLFDDLALLAAEDVVVSAVRHAQPIEESPSAITVITREQIRESGQVDLVELLRLVPGADVFRINQGHIAVGLRSRSTYGGDRLLALIDGRDFAPLITGLPVWMGMPIDIDSIERVEIIRGPASTLYGANALQGVINIVTRKPTTEQKVSMEADASLAGRFTHMVNARAHGASGNLSWWVSAGYDHRAPHERPEERDLEALRARALTTYAPKTDRSLTVELGASRLQGSIHVLDMGRGTIDAIQPYLRSRLRLGRTEVQLIAEYNEFALDVDLGVNLPVEDGDPLPLVTAPTINQPTFSTEVTGAHHLELFEGNRLTAGLSLRTVHHLKGAMVRCPDVGFQDFDPAYCEPFEELEASLGLFIQDEWQLTDNLVFTGGLRFDYNSLTPEPAFSPRTALVFRPSKNHALRASYGRAYRKPTVLQSHGRVLFDEVSSAPADLRGRVAHLFAYGIGNPDLLNEKADSYEIGWRGRFLDGKLIATTDLFHGRFFDTIWFVKNNVALEAGLGGVETLPADAEIMFMNREGDLPSWSWGGETTLTLQPSNMLELRGTYGLDYFKETLRDEETHETFVRVVPLEPMHRLIGSIRLRPLPGLVTSVDALWVSKYQSNLPDPESILLPTTLIDSGGHVLLNGSVAFRPTIGRSNLEIGISAFNILDGYALDMPRLETADGYFGAERLTRRVRVFVRGAI